MATRNSKNPSSMQSNLQALVNGLTTSCLTLLNTLIVLGTSMSKASVIAQLKAYLALCNAVMSAKQAYESAVSARKNAEEAMHAFYASVVASVKQALGPANLGQLSSLGIAAPADRKAPSAETKVIAQAKAAATRKARGIIGKKQRSAILASPGASVQVVGLSPASAANPAPTASSVTPTPSSATPAPAAPVATPGAANPTASS